MINEAESPRAGILTSWKEIANYLGKGVRTVQRWELYMGLPVRRPDGQDNKVLAYCSDLDAWLHSNWTRRPPREINDIPEKQVFDLTPLRERCEGLRAKQKVLREQLERNVVTLYEQCDSLRRACALPSLDVRHTPDSAEVEDLRNSRRVQVLPRAG